MYQPNGVPSSSLVPSNPVVQSQLLDAMDPVSGANSGSNNSNLASKQRLRWTHELHERFVDAVAQLGGPDREFFFLDNIIFTLMLTAKREEKEKKNQFC